MQRRSILVTSTFAYPLAKSNTKIADEVGYFCHFVCRKAACKTNWFRFPAAARLLCLFVLPVLWGCQTTPQGLRSSSGEEDYAAEAAGLHRDDDTFLKIADGFAHSGQIEFFFSFDTLPAGREIAGEYLPEAVREIDRVRRIWGAVSAAGLSAPYTLVMEMTVSRFLSSMALNSRGWTRTDWGVWQHPAEAVTVSFFPERLWVVTGRTGESDTPAGVPDDAVIPDLAGRALNGSDYLAGLLILDGPELEGIPPELAPLELRAFLFGSPDATAGSFVVELIFPDERRARIALVPLRLLASRFIESYGFVLHDDFDILRSGDTIRIHGLSLVKPKGALSVDGY